MITINIWVVVIGGALIGNYASARITYKWIIKVVIHFIEEAVLNAFILYNKQFPGKNALH